MFGYREDVGFFGLKLRDKKGIIIIYREREKKIDGWKTISLIKKKKVARYT
jgi:hypothetical protein